MFGHTVYKYQNNGAIDYVDSYFICLVIQEISVYPLLSKFHN